MKKRAISLMLMTALIINSGVISVKATNIDSYNEKSFQLINPDEEKYEFSVQDKSSIKVTNIGQEEVAIDNNGSNYYERIYDYIKYDKDGNIIDFEQGTINSIVLTNGESLYITVNSNDGMIFRVKESQKDLIKLEEKENKALHEFKFESGKNYRIKNNNKTNIKIKNDSSVYNNKIFDSVNYDRDGKIIDYSHNAQGNISLGINESVNISNISESYITCYLPEEFKGKITISETKDYAITEYVFKKGENYSIKNNNKNNIILKNDSNGYYSRNYDYVKYKKDGSIDTYNHSVTGDIFMQEGEAVRISVLGEDITAYLPSDYADSIIKKSVDQTALSISRFESGKNYTIKNNNQCQVIANNNSNITYGRTYDYVVYDSEGKVKLDKDSYVPQDDFGCDSEKSIILDYKESIRITVAREIISWIPQEYSNNFEIEETKDTALKKMVLENGQSIKIKNNSKEKVSFSSNASGSRKINWDSITYDKDSNIESVDENSYKNFFSLESETSIKLTSIANPDPNGEYAGQKCIIWTPTENMDKVEFADEKEQALYQVSINPGKTVKIKNESKENFNIEFGSKMNVSTEGDESEEANGSGYSWVCKAGTTINVTNGETKVSTISVPTELLSNGLTIDGDYLKIEATSLKIDKDNETIKNGENLKLNCIVQPYRIGEQKVTWKSSDENIATVDENGNVKTKTVGNVVITATSVDNKELSAKANITIVDELPIKYKVTLKDNLGNTLGDIQQVEEGKNAVLPTEDHMPKIEGMKFVSWDSDGTNITKDTEITAKYIIDTTYTVTFMVDGIQYGDIQIVKSGENASKPKKDPTRKGYIFKEWDTKIKNVMDNIVVNAVFEEDPNAVKYKVSFLDNYGNKIGDDQEVYQGDGAIAPKAPEKEGYKFKGWDKKFDKVTGDLKVSAVYEEIKYRVKFVDSKGKLIGEVQEITRGNAAIAPEAPSKEGYTFKNWDSDFSNITSDLTIKAIYDKNNDNPVTTGDAAGFGIILTSIIGAVSTLASRKKKR